jgi:hypothetical protein
LKKKRKKTTATGDNLFRIQYANIEKWKKKEKKVRKAKHTSRFVNHVAFSEVYLSNPQEMVLSWDLKPN